jgi:hypothetical protein
MNYIGTKINKPIQNYDFYASVAAWCNGNNATIEDKGDYYEVVAIVPHIPTIQEQVEALESQYGMNRWQREGILAEGSLYSQYTKDKAQQIEDLAKDLRPKGE